MQEVCAGHKVRIELSKGGCDGIAWWKRMVRPGGDRIVL